MILRDLANPIYDSSDVNQWGGMKIMPSKNSTQTGVLPFGGVHMEKETAGQSGKYGIRNKTSIYTYGDNQDPENYEIPTRTSTYADRVADLKVERITDVCVDEAAEPYEIPVRMSICHV